MNEPLQKTLADVVSFLEQQRLPYAAGRPQDDQDVRGLVIAQGSSIDWEYCRRVARELGEALGVDLPGRVAALRPDHP